MKKKRSKFKKARLIPFIFAGGVVFMVGGFYLYNQLSVSVIELDAAPLSDSTSVGEPIDIKVDIRNDSKSPLKNAELSVSLPADVAFLSGESGKIKRVEIGEVGPGGSEEQIIRVVPLPGSEASREIHLTLTYSIGSITAIFEKTKIVPIVAAPAPVSLDLEYPEKILSDEEFEIVAKYGYSGGDALHDLKLQIDYPSSFSKTSSAPKADVSEKVWSIAEIKSGDSGKVSLKGRAYMPDNSTLAMQAKLLLRILGRDYPILVQDISIGIIPSPLSLSLHLSGEQESAYKPGDILNYTLLYKNNTDIQFQNLSIKAKLTGQMYDFGTLAVNNASFDQLTKTISWNVATLPGLSSLDPESTGSVTFAITLKSSYPIRRLNDKNFVISAEARIESPTVPKLISATKTVNTAKLENKIMGMVIAETKALFRDAESLILNAGPFPPRVDTPTDFTIHWKISNFATDTRDIEVRTQLEDGVVFTGVVKGNIATLPVVDEEAGEVVWKIPKLFATAGITDVGPEAIFQIRATPSDVLVGNYMSLIGATSVKAIDEFTGLQISSVDEAQTTLLSDDKTIKEGEGRVVR